MLEPNREIWIKKKKENRNLETRKPNFFYFKPFSEKKTNWLDLARKKPTQLSLTKWWLFIRRCFIAKSGSKQWMKWRKFKHPSTNLATFLNLILKSNVIHNSKKPLVLFFIHFVILLLPERKTLESWVPNIWSVTFWFVCFLGTVISPPLSTFPFCPDS
jgi:hypothetical protein